VGRSDASIATVNSGNATTFNLTALKKFVVYHIQMLAYTAVGDGATSLPALSVRTFEDGTPAFFCVLSIFRIFTAIHFAFLLSSSCMSFVFLYGLHGRICYVTVCRKFGCLLCIGEFII